MAANSEHRYRPGLPHHRHPRDIQREPFGRVYYVVSASRFIASMADLLPPKDTSRTAILWIERVRASSSWRPPGPSGERREAFRQPLGPNDDRDLASYLRIEERKLEAGGLN